MPYSSLLRTIAIATSLAALTGCGKPASNVETTATKEPTVTAPVEDAGPEPGRDYQSYANISDYTATHVALDIAVDFEASAIDGTATIDFERVTADNPPLVLDTRDMDIIAVRSGNNESMSRADFVVGDMDDLLGAPLKISIGSADTRVEVDYKTRPEASGLQWLNPAQTAGKQYPFLFTQAQPTHARSFVPLQDTPGVRITYDAVVRVPVALRAVMSADNTADRGEDGVYRFSMPQRIPSYLMALAVGDLDFKAMGERTGVYAEAEILDAAAAEFEDTESMLEATEARFGPYRWDRYDLLILPPSFPFGGMENPRLSFITPTVIAGDKSLVALIAHELAHSWSGNLVTNASWRDLWLNEGFTTYLTNRIMQFVYGDERYQMEMALGFADLESGLADLPEIDQILALDIRDRDPDEAFSSIPYEKGSLFLYEIEQKVGREAFDQFLAAYFDEFAFESLHTERFIEYLDKTLLTTHADQLDRDRILEWIYQPGLPEGAPQPTSDAFTIVDSARGAFLDGSVAAASLETDGWTYHQWKHFLDDMPEQLSVAQLDALDDAYALTASTNNEIAFSWLMIAIRNGYEPADARLENFLMTIGRNKFLRPLYQALVDAGEHDRAKRIFDAAKSGYHPLTVRRNGQIVEGPH
ncbi:MAG: M1 family metallopeptidase [Pseudomonadota bacterium]